MESVELNMDDIFEMEDGDEGDRIPSALPDLPRELEPLDNGDDNIASTQDEENAEVLAKLKGMKGAGKKIVRRPQPKLDGARLTGERGIATLPRIFKDVKFKGRGHEAEDLRVTMKYLEHWAHRLFPMMPFDEVLERIEKLGTKNDVKTCIKKMRLDIPVLQQDFEEEAEEDDPPSPLRGNQDTIDAEEAFDEIMREEQEQRAQSQKAPPPAQQAPPPSQPTTPAANTSSLPNGLTPEQLQKIERNKRIAMEKRAARLAAQQAAGSQVPSATEKQPEVTVNPLVETTQEEEDKNSHRLRDPVEPVQKLQTEESGSLTTSDFAPEGYKQTVNGNTVSAVDNVLESSKREQVEQMEFIEQSGTGEESQHLVRENSEHVGDCERRDWSDGPTSLVSAQTSSGDENKAGEKSTELTETDDSNLGKS